MVEWKFLNDICGIYDGTHQTPKYTDSGVKFVSVENINAPYRSQKYISEDDYSRSYKTKPQKGDVLMTRIGDVGTCTVLDNDEPIAYYVSLALLRPNSQLVLSNYVKYILESNIGKRELRKKTLLTAVPLKINLGDVGKLKLPIPSLEEQNRIVGILDTFTASIDNLKEQIAQRRKQFEYYRDQLLDLEGKEGVEMKSLGKLCEIKGRIGFRGYTREDQVEEGEGVISLSPGNIEDGKMVYNGCTYITWDKYNESPEIMTFNGDVLFCKTGSTVGKVAMVDNLPCEATINPQLVVLKNISINSKFLKYSLGTFRIQSIVKRLAGVGSVPNISQEKLGNLEILLPSLSEQQRIVDILDKFEASIQNLEAQLSQREKQYEYYRNKLLTFE